jgi:hypothetical protein
MPHFLKHRYPVAFGILALLAAFGALSLYRTADTPSTPSMIAVSNETTTAGAIPAISALTGSVPLSAKSVEVPSKLDSEYGEIPVLSGTYTHRH